MKPQIFKLLDSSRFWVVVGCVVFFVALLLVIFWGEREEWKAELGWHQRATAASVAQLARLFSQARLQLLKGDARKSLGLGREDDELWLGTAIVNERGEMEDVFPAILAAQVKSLFCPQASEGWGVVKAGADGLAGGWVAYCLAVDGRYHALLVHLPKALAKLGEVEVLPGPYVLLFQVPDDQISVFSCERLTVPNSHWICSPRENPLTQAIPQWPSQSSALAVAGGTVFTYAIPMKGGKLQVAFYLTSGSLTGRLALVWLGLFALGVALVTGGVVLARTLAWAKRKGAELEADMGRREAELSARVAEQQWRVLLEGVTQPMLFLRNNLVVRANQAATSLLGFEQRADLLGKRFEELLAPEERERTLKLLPVSTVAESAFTTTLVGQDGNLRVVELKPWKLGLHEGAVVCLSLTDYTGQEKAESQLAALFSQIPAGVALLDRKGLVLRASRNLLTLLGLRESDLIGGSLLAFAAIPERGLLKRAFVSARKGRPKTVTIRCRLAGDVITLAEVTFFPVMTAGRTWGVLMVADRVQPQMSEKSTEAFFLVQAVVVNHAHRCGNIIQNLLVSQKRKRGAGQLVEDGIAELARVTQRMGKLFQTPGTQLRPTDLNLLLEETAEELLSSVPPHVRLVLRPAHVPVWVMGDRDQLAYFLREAVGASLQCLGKGTGTIEVALERPSSGNWRLAISDTGEVMEDQAQETWTLASRLYARGMALLVARTHKGEAGYRERVGFGARVWIDFPPASAAALRPSVQEPLPTGKILVVDDEKGTRESLVAILREQGYETLAAEDGRQAIARYLEDPEGIALIVLDLVMPEVDGREVYEAISQYTPRPLVLLCTGYVPTADPLLATLPMLLKPFTINDFLEAVRRLLASPAG